MSDEQTVKSLHADRSKMWDASIANHAKYMSSETGLFDEQYTEPRHCPACASSNELFLFNKEGGRYVKCNDCEMVYLNPVFKDEYLEDYYRSNHQVQGEVVENDSEFYAGLYKQGLASIETQAPKGRILDVGCSTGVFLSIARDLGWQTHGVELNQEEAKHCASKGHSVHNKLLQEVEFEHKFDAVTLWDVFEHLKNGSAYFAELKALLNPGGVIFLQIPSADSLAAKMLQQACNMYDGLEHVNLYSHKGISILAEKTGLKIVGIQTVISEIGVMNNYLNYESPYFGGTVNKSDVLSLIDEKALHDKLLGYKFQVVLAKQ
ncbi:MAG: SAM-dependent methyltransferase [Pseudohongiellaceae bacterium]|jgi:SAM-dependent methyltransferase